MHTPSKAQAKLIARLWGSGKGTLVQPDGPKDPTVLACIKRGWLSPTDERGTFPNGAAFIAYAPSLDGLKAMCKAVSVSGS